MYVFIFLCGLFFLKDALTEVCEAEDKYAWSYHGPNNGPSEWHERYPFCGGPNQSPIKISKNRIVNLRLDKLVYSGFDTPITNATVVNLGWTVMVFPEDGVTRSIAFRKNNYTLDEIHFHFGSESDPGAAHVLFGTRYEMEIHYVLKQGNNPNVVAVVAALMQADSDPNTAFDPITEVLSSVKYRNDSTQLQSELNLESLLPQDPESYYLYLGSNAIPPCGFLPWVILKNVGKVGKDELNSFMDLYSVGEDDASELCMMGPNYRPTQKIGLRPILASK